jgi:ATP-binding cassette subfamily C protein
MVVSGEVNVFFVKVDEEGEYLSALKYLYLQKEIYYLVYDLLNLRITPVNFSNEATYYVSIKINLLLLILSF